MKSTALLFAERTRAWIAGFAVLTVLGLGLAIWLDGLAWPAYAALLAPMAHLAWQVARVQFGSPTDCLRMFRANRDFGLPGSCGVGGWRLTRF